MNWNISSPSKCNVIRLCRFTERTVIKGLLLLKIPIKIMMFGRIEAIANKKLIMLMSPTPYEVFEGIFLLYRNILTHQQRTLDF